jgi:hypothetical protein
MSDARTLGDLLRRNEVELGAVPVARGTSEPPDGDPRLIRGSPHRQPGRSHARAPRPGRLTGGATRCPPLTPPLRPAGRGQGTARRNRPSG